MNRWLVIVGVAVGLWLLIFVFDFSVQPAEQLLVNLTDAPQAQGEAHQLTEYSASNFTKVCNQKDKAVVDNDIAYAWEALGDEQKVAKLKKKSKEQPYLTDQDKHALVVTAFDEKLFRSWAVAGSEDQAFS